MNNYISACQRDFPVHPSLHISIYILIHPQVTCTQEKKNSTGVSTICKCCISSVHIHLLSSNKKVAHSLFSSKQGQKCALCFLHLY